MIEFKGNTASMVSADINIDKLIDDIDQQIEIISAIAADNAILNEQLRLLHESRETVAGLQLEIERLAELIDPDDLIDHSSIIDRYRQGEEAE